MKKVSISQMLHSGWGKPKRERRLNKHNSEPIFCNPECKQQLSPWPVNATIKFVEQKLRQHTLNRLHIIIIGAPKLYIYIHVFLQECIVSSIQIISHIFTLYTHVVCATVSMDVPNFYLHLAPVEPCCARSVAILTARMVATGTGRHLAGLEPAG